MSYANTVFARPDGSDCAAYSAAPTAANRRAVIVLQEWWGLNTQICSVVDRLTAAGYSALAPDLYHGRVAQDADEASHLMQGLDFAGATFQDIRGAVAHLQQLGCEKIAVMGFCMGGALTIACAVHLPEIHAAVCYYGIPPHDFADPAQIRIPLQAHFALRDDWCTPAAAAALEQSLREAGQAPEIYHYDAEHAFFNALRPEVYDPAASTLAWQRTLNFLQQQL